MPFLSSRHLNKLGKVFATDPATNHHMDSTSGGTHEALNADTSKHCIQLTTRSQYAIGPTLDDRFDCPDRIRCEIHRAMEGNLHRLR